MSETCTITEETIKIENKIILRIKNRRKIKWDPKVIDNEHMNKKKSKCCCSHPSKCPHNSDHH